MGSNSGHVGGAVQYSDLHAVFRYRYPISFNISVRKLLTPELCVHEEENEQSNFSDSLSGTDIFKFLLSQPKSTSTHVGSDKVISWTTTPPQSIF